MTIVAFVGGMAVGCFLGVSLMCLLVAGKEADRKMGITDND